MHFREIFLHSSPYHHHTQRAEETERRGAKNDMFCFFYNTAAKQPTKKAKTKVISKRIPTKRIIAIFGESIVDIHIESIHDKSIAATFTASILAKEFVPKVLLPCTPKELLPSTWKVFLPKVFLPFVAGILLVGILWNVFFCGRWQEYFR